MSKVGLIIKREYLSRVRKKTFILTTILTPLLFIGMIAAVVFITAQNVRNEKLAVVDAQGVLKSNLKNVTNGKQPTNYVKYTKINVFHITANNMGL